MEFALLCHIFYVINTFILPFMCICCLQIILNHNYAILRCISDDVYTVEKVENLVVYWKLYGHTLCVCLKWLQILVHLGPGIWVYRGWNMSFDSDVELISMVSYFHDFPWHLLKFSAIITLNRSSLRFRQFRSNWLPENCVCNDVNVTVVKWIYYLQKYLKHALQTLM